MSNVDFIVSADDFKKLSKDIYKLIDAEFESKEDLANRHSQLLTMYEFFRLLRGEAFTKYREPVSDFQNELYQMEDQLAKKFKEIEESQAKQDNLDVSNQVITEFLKSVVTLAPKYWSSIRIVFKLNSKDQIEEEYLSIINGTEQSFDVPDSGEKEKFMGLFENDKLEQIIANASSDGAFNLEIKYKD